MKLNNWYFVWKSVPSGSLTALLVTWIGLILFSTKLYEGADTIAGLSQDLFSFLIPWITVFKTGLVVLCLFMFILTLVMALIGCLATRHCYNAYKGEPQEIKLGSKIMCGIFVILSYALYTCWLGILSIVVVMTSAYVAFLPICTPDAGIQSTFCFNFTMMSVLLHEQHNTPITKLVLCGEPLDKFCRLTKGITPWYAGAYVGCIVVLMGLSHFTSCMAANFAHGHHARKYRKWHSNKTCGTPKPLYIDENGSTVQKDTSGATKV